MRRGIRRGHAASVLVERVIAMRVQSGDRRWSMTVEIGRLFGVPMRLLIGRRDLGLRR